MTRTYTLLEVSSSTYAEIKAALQDAGYAHAINKEGEIDMHGIAITLGAAIARHCTICKDEL